MIIIEKINMKETLEGRKPNIFENNSMECDMIGRNCSKNIVIIFKSKLKRAIKYKSKEEY
jgi:hypothetical protein